MTNAAALTTLLLAVVGCGGRSTAGASDSSGALLGPEVAQAVVSSEYSNSRICVGTSHACGISNNGRVTCWRSAEAQAMDCGSYSRAAPGLATANALPIADCGQSSPPSGDFIEVTCGTAHSCGIRRDGEVVCWGLNNVGQLAVPPNKRFRHVRAAGHETCGVTTEGEAECWGQHAFHSNETWLVADVGVTGSWDNSEYDPALGLKTAMCGLLLKNRERVCLTWSGEIRHTEGYNLRDAVEGSAMKYSDYAETAYECKIASEGSLHCAPWSWTPPSGHFVALTRVGRLGSPCALSEDGEVICFSKNAVEFPRLPHMDYAQDMHLTVPLSGRFVEISGSAFGLCGRTAAGSVSCRYLMPSDIANDPTPSVVQ